MNARQLLLVLALLNACGHGERPLSGVTPLYANLDFGQVLPAESRTLKVAVTLHGPGPVDLAVVGSTVPPGFTVDTGSGPLASGGTRDVAITFTPPDSGTYEGIIVVEVRGAPGPLHIEVKATVPGALDVEPLGCLDFGPVPLGSQATLPLSIKEQGNVERRVTIAADDPAIRIAPAAVDMFPLSSHQVDVTFRPQHGRDLQGRIQVRCPGCPDVVRCVKGTGITDELVLEPGLLDFGTIRPDVSLCRDVTARNVGNLPATPTALSLQSSGGFELTDGNFLNTEILPGESGPFLICFHPIKDGAYSARPVLTTASGRKAEMEVEGNCGGPMLAPEPTSLDLGVTTPSAPVTRALLLHNVGQPGSMFIDSIAVGRADLISVTLPDPGGFDVGKSDLRVQATFAASAAGDYADTLTIRYGSPGDPYESVLEVPVTAHVIEASPCTLRYPARVRFGMVHYRQTYTRSVRVTNLDASNDCPVWGIELSPQGENAGMLSLSSAPKGLTRLPPGGELDLTLTFAPNEGSIESDLDLLQLHTIGAAGNEEVVDIPVSGFATQLTVDVTPDPIDMGAIPLGYVKHMEVGTPNDNFHQISFGGPNPAAGVAFSAESPPSLSVSDVPPMPVTVASGDAFSFVVDFAPTVPGPVQGELEIGLENAQEPIVVPVIGEALDIPCGELCNAPTAICPPEKKGWTQSTLELAGAAYDQSSGPLTCSWDVLERPDGSTAAPESGSCATRFVPDREGQYTFQLTVRNAAGYTATCQTEVLSKDYPGLLLETTWSDPGDIDLHFFHPLAGDVLSASTWFSLPYDCYYSNQNPFWDTLGRPDDPDLVLDDRVGQGPERLLLEQPSTEHGYEVGVHWFANPHHLAAEIATTRIICAGKLAAELPSHLTQLFLAAHVASVAWNEDGTCSVTRAGETLMVVP